MDDEVRQALKNVTDAYDDFVNCYVKDLRGNAEGQKKMLKFLQDNPDAKSDDVMEYVDTEILGIGS